MIWFLEQTLPDGARPRTTCDIKYSINWAHAILGKVSCLVGTSHVWLFGRTLVADTGDHIHICGGELVGEEVLYLQGFSFSAQEASFFDKYSPQDLFVSPV